MTPLAFTLALLLATTASAQPAFQWNQAASDPVSPLSWASDLFIDGQLFAETSYSQLACTGDPAIVPPTGVLWRCSYPVPTNLPPGSHTVQLATVNAAGLSSDRTAPLTFAVDGSPTPVPIPTPAPQPSPCTFGSTPNCVPVPVCSGSGCPQPGPIPVPTPTPTPPPPGPLSAPNGLAIVAGQTIVVPMKLTWAPVDGAAAYWVQVFSSGGTLVHEDQRDLSPTSYLPLGMPAGIYTWQVAACTSLEMASCGAWSTLGSFQR